MKSVKQNLVAAATIALLTGSAFASTNLVVNGGFELPTPLAAGSHARFNFIPTGWQYSGTNPYPLVGSGGFGYRAAADGTTLLAIESERNGLLYQDLGTLKAGTTYSFAAYATSSNGINSYRISLFGDPNGANKELAYITDANFNPSAGTSQTVGFSYTATAADDGKLLRLGLSDNGRPSFVGGKVSRTAFDAVSVTAAAPVPEPSSALLLALGLGGLVQLKRKGLGRSAV